VIPDEVALPQCQLDRKLRAVCNLLPFHCLQRRASAVAGSASAQ
jgi:hypothetical protein